MPVGQGQFISYGASSDSSTIWILVFYNHHFEQVLTHSLECFISPPEKNRKFLILRRYKNGILAWNGLKIFLNKLDHPSMALVRKASEKLKHKICDYNFYLFVILIN